MLGRSSLCDMDYFVRPNGLSCRPPTMPRAYICRPYKHINTLQQCKVCYIHLIAHDALNARALSPLVRLPAAVPTRVVIDI